ncbi:MAG: hypothetical protein ACYDBP_02285 [Leptospirales bacterium]
MSREATIVLSGILPFGQDILSSSAPIVDTHYPRVRKCLPGEFIFCR